MAATAEKAAVQTAQILDKGAKHSFAFENENEEEEDDGNLGDDPDTGIDDAGDSSAVVHARRLKRYATSSEKVKKRAFLIGYHHN